MTSLEGVEVIQLVNCVLIFNDYFSTFNFSVVYDNKIYIFGGYNTLEEKHFNDMYEFEPVTCKWREINTLGSGPCARRRQACVLVGDRVFLFGGTR